MKANGAPSPTKRTKSCGPGREHGNGVESFVAKSACKGAPLQTTRLLQTDFPPKAAQTAPAGVRTNARHLHRRAQQQPAAAVREHSASPALHEEPGEGGAAGRAGRLGAARQRGRPPGLRLLHLRHRRRRRRLRLPREQGPYARRRRGQGRRRRGRGRGRGGARRIRPAHRAGARHLRLRQRRAYAYLSFIFAPTDALLSFRFVVVVVVVSGHTLVTG